jgi:MSP (Major sperm protein) domain
LQENLVHKPRLQIIMHFALFVNYCFLCGYHAFNNFIIEVPTIGRFGWLHYAINVWLVLTVNFNAVFLAAYVTCMQLTSLYNPTDNIAGSFVQPITVELKLTNSSELRVFFKIKTTAPKQYAVQPRNDIVEPGGQSVVKSKPL